MSIFHLLVINPLIKSIFVPLTFVHNPDFSGGMQPNGDESNSFAIAAAY